MKILQVNKFWYPHGGADVYCLQLTHELQKAGHEVARFGMEHPNNEPSPWNPYFVAQSNYQHDRPTPWAAWKFINNREAARKFTLLIEDFQPDVIHVHNIYHQLTTSILPIAKNSGAKVIMTAHDYKIISPNYSMFARGRITEATKIHKYYRLFLAQSSDESFPRRILLMLEAYYNLFLRRYSTHIDLIIAPSYFLQKKLHEYRVRIKTTVLHNFVRSEIDTDPIPQQEREDFVLYVGRLSAEKGIQTLIAAAELLPEQKFFVIGEGSSKPKQWPTNVVFLGYQSHATVRDYMRRAKALIVPSEWYEVNSLVIPEAHTVGTWVIAAQTNSIDVLTDGVNGWWFEMGNAGDLAEKIHQLKDLKHSYTPYTEISIEDHVAKIEQIYRATTD
jgi:glycosyltransferase involved in cell wall biosynthesis